MIEIKVPTVGESISEVTLAKWTKADGTWVERDEVICELESEKATFELNAEQAGILKQFAKEEDTLKIGDLVCSIDEQAARPAASTTSSKEVPKPMDVPKPMEVPRVTMPKEQVIAPAVQTHMEFKTTPLAAEIIADKQVDISQVIGSNPSGKITKSDVLQAIENQESQAHAKLDVRKEDRKKMSNLRKTISRRLVEAKIVLLC